jgi:hypothetical protein
MNRLRVLALDRPPATAEQVEDQHYRRNNEQQVNQPGSNVADQAQEPQKDKKNDDCPKHIPPPDLSFYPHPQSRLQGCFNPTPFAFRLFNDTPNRDWFLFDKRR